jgi:hypothetical protein
MKRQCLTEEELLELYYQEEFDKNAKAHIAECEKCQQSFSRLCDDLLDLDLPVPDAGYKALAEVLEIIEADETSGQKEEILTPEEAADWFKVSPHNIYNILHQIPHLVIDGNIRFTRKALQSFLDTQYSKADKKAPDQLEGKIIPLAGRRAG